MTGPSRRKNRRPARATSSPPPAGRQRLQKILASAGFGSRRQCEDLITAGRVEVDRKVTTQLGTTADPREQEIRVDGVALRKPRLLYYAVHKPPGVVSTNSDPTGRPRVIDLVPAGNARLFAVGRLDLNSEGLILVTNDGELSHRLTHPSFEVPKIYRVQVAGRPSPEVLAALRRGVHLAEGLARAEGVRVVSHHKESTNLEMLLREGRNREIRRMLARAGHKVLRLTRIAVGPVRLGKLPPGGARPLTKDELNALRQAAREVPRD